MNFKLDKLDLLKKCVRHRKNIYSFDPINNEYCEKFKQENLSCYFPQVCEENIPQNQFGKMHLISKPILGVLGTNSKQGKFTLQLELRKRFLENGYKIGQLGTEPTALLFGMDSVYHSGYNSNIFFNRWENYIFTNKLLNEIAQKENDILLVGSQSSVTPYCFNNTNFFNPFHLEFIQACQFDAVILTINTYDTSEYIKRTIQTIEGLSDAKVIALVLFSNEIKRRLWWTYRRSS